MRKYFVLIAVSVVVLDRIAKWAVATYVPLHDSLTVIPGFFHITHVENPGAAFGLFAPSRQLRGKLERWLVFRSSLSLLCPFCSGRTVIS